MFPPTLALPRRWTSGSRLAPCRLIKTPMIGSGRESTLLRSLASSWLGLAVGIVVSFFLSPFVVNKLGSTWYGVWAVASQFVGYLYLMDFGVRESVVRYTSKYAARRNPRH